MAQRTEGHQGAPPKGLGAVKGLETGSPSVMGVLAEVKRCLEDGQARKALEAIGRSKTKSPWLTNALGVCQLRLGNGAGAVEIFRRLVVKDGIHLREDVPPVFKVNFAAALLATDNFDGFLSVLSEIGDDDHPAIRRYREAYRRWRASLPLWQRVK